MSSNRDYSRSEDYDWRIIRLLRDTVNLSNYTDDELMVAWEEFVVSTDYPNYAAITKWLPPRKKVDA